MKLIRMFLIPLVVSVAGLSVVMAQEAEKEPTPEERAVEGRQDLMHVLSAQRGIMRDMADAKRPTDAVTFTNAANALAALARMIPEAFAKEGMTPDSTAKPDVWTNPSDFAVKANALSDKAGEIAKLAATDIKGAGVMAKEISECGGCHDHYRVED